MPEMPGLFRPPGQRTRAETRRDAERHRVSARARGYDTNWDKARKGHLAHNPLCRYCEVGAWGDEPRTTPAEMVDHLYPHNGDQAVFWDTARWVSCCHACHNGPKQRCERKGRAALVALEARIAG